MSDNKSIKQKMKESKKKVRENAKNESRKKVNILFGIFAGIFEGIGTFLITKESTWYGIAMVCYVVLYSYIFHYLIGTYLENKKKLNIDGYEKSLIFLGMISLFIICIKRGFGLSAFILPVVNFIYNLADMTNYNLYSTWNERKNLKGDGAKAFNLELRKIVIVTFVLGLIGALSISGIYKYISSESGVFSIIIGSVIFILIWNLIVKIILGKITESRVKVLNYAFNLNIGKLIQDYGTSSRHNINIVYNYLVMYYRLFAFIFTFSLVFIFTHFDLGITIILTSCYVLICKGYPQYDDGLHMRYREPETVATIYDKNGNRAGEIKKY